MTGRGRRWSRGQRVAAIMSTLLNRPGELYTLSTFAAELGAAKSTVSEDIALIRSVLGSLDMGRVSTVTGATGGVRYQPVRSAPWVSRQLARLATSLSAPERILPGGFLYITDLVFDPFWSQRIGEVFATVFADVKCDAVVTVETKGIPLALMTARALAKPLVSCRRDSQATEGTAISISYVSGSRRRIQTMSLPKRALKPGSRVLVIDDFLRGGGTAKGVRELMAEFGAQVVGTGVLVAMGRPQRKLIDDYLPLILLDEVDESRGKVTAKPNRHLVDGLNLPPV